MNYSHFSEEFRELYIFINISNKYMDIVSLYDTYIS